MNVALFLDALLSPALFTSAIFGFLIGAFYGYSLSKEDRVIYPYSLWIVGMGWVVIVGILAAFGEGPFHVEEQFARGILWTILCGMAAIGRAGRIRFETWRIHRRTKKLRAANMEE